MKHVVKRNWAAIVIGRFKGLGVISGLMINGPTNEQRKMRIRESNAETYLDALLF